MWLLSPFILSMLASPLCGEDVSAGEGMEKGELTQRPLFMQSQKKQPCTSCCSPALNYRLAPDFYGYNTFVEYLIWQTQEQGSHFVAKPNSSSSINTTFNKTQLLGDIKSASLGWASGVRVGFGYTFERDAFQLLGQYTWYSTSGSNSFSVSSPISASTTTFLMPTFTDIEGAGLLNAASNTEFSYQMADLLLARRFIVKDQIQLNFSLGATGGFIKEDFHVTYENQTENTYIANDWGFGGGGLRTGIDGNWHMGYGFGFFGKFSFAAILGNYGNSNRITADAPGADGTGSTSSPIVSDTQYSGIFLLPTTQIALGFDWTRSFKNCWISAVKASVTGEFNNLSNLQQVFKDPSGVTSQTYYGKLLVRDVGSVYMYGANVRLGADF